MSPIISKSSVMLQYWVFLLNLSLYKQALAQAIVSRRKNIATVLAKMEKITGESRTAAYEVLLGDTTVTVHREFGFSYRIDVGRLVLLIPYGIRAEAGN